MLHGVFVLDDIMAAEHVGDVLCAVGHGAGEHELVGVVAGDADLQATLVRVAGGLAEHHAKCLPGHQRLARQRHRVGLTPGAGGR